MKDHIMANTQIMAELDRLDSGMLSTVLIGNSNTVINTGLSKVWCRAIKFLD